MILDQAALGIAQRVLDGLYLLREISAAAIGLDHLENALEVTPSLFEAKGNLLVLLNAHMNPYTLGGRV
ncbi:hypothetical protein GCM10007207_21640 [Asaia siamensis]|uniref:Uncharacterized protein n=1 Tax=Asaia siamensis TaxID=110479 RepID=A0ABQ1MDQ7_9PROT|nr:hypothetical protein GCM10007207_21640 [Asaia siamensis]